MARQAFLSLFLAALLLVTAQAQHLRNLRRRRRKSNSASVPEICEFIYEQDILEQFSQCANDAEVLAQDEFDCSADELQNYDACSSRPECSWWHLLGQDLCMPNPCFRINNGLCTIQNTGGRCVWYTRQQNKEVRGINAPGCYKSPCSNPLDNTPSGCAAKSDAFYGCVWCPKHEGQAYGCMNAKSTSQAQCWNVNGPGALPGCNDCKQKDFGACKDSTCSKNCCQSPLCLCDLSEGERGANEVAINILSGR